MKQAILLSVLVALISSGAVSAIPADPESTIVARGDGLDTRDIKSFLFPRGDDDDEVSDDEMEKLLGFKPERKDPKGDKKHIGKDDVVTDFGSDASHAKDQDHDDEKDTGKKRDIAAGLETRAPKWPFPSTKAFRDYTFNRKCLKTKKNKPIYYGSFLSKDEYEKADEKTDPKIEWVDDEPNDKILGAYVCDHNLPLQFMAACFPLEQDHWKKYDHDEKISDIDPKAYKFLQDVMGDAAKTSSDKKVKGGYDKLFAFANHPSNGFGVPKNANNFLGVFDTYGVSQSFKDADFKTFAEEPPFKDFTRVEGALLHTYRKNTQENFNQKVQEFSKVIQLILKSDGGFDHGDAEKAGKQVEVFIPKFFKASLESELGLTKKMKTIPSGFKKENCNYKAD